LFSSDLLRTGPGLEKHNDHNFEIDQEKIIPTLKVRPAGVKSHNRELADNL